MLTTMTISELLSKIDPRHTAPESGEHAGLLVCSGSVQSEWDTISFEPTATVEGIPSDGKNSRWLVRDSSGAFVVIESPNGYVFAENTAEYQAELAREITFERNFEVNDGRYTELKHVRVQPYDVGWDYVEARSDCGHDLTNPETREWWKRRCRAEGEIMVLQESEKPEMLDAIAERASLIDWAYAMQQLGDTSDHDVIMDIIQELLDAQAALERERIRAAQVESGRATAEKLGAKGKAKRAQAGASARWGMVPYRNYKTAQKSGFEPHAITDSINGGTVWAIYDHLLGAEVVEGETTIITAPKLGGVTHPQFARRFQVVKAPIGYVVACTEVARVDVGPAMLMPVHDGDAVIWWYGGNLKAARAGLKKLISTYTADVERWEVEIQSGRPRGGGER